MKTKLTLLFIMLFTGSTLVMAQSSEDCINTGSIFIEHAKVKNYDAAYAPFKELLANCPKYSYALYQYGERLYRDKMEKATSDADKKTIAEEFIKMYELKRQNYPEKTPEGGNLTDIGVLMYENNIGSKMDQFNKFKEAWDKDKVSFTSAKALYMYFVLGVELEDAGQMNLTDIFTLYDDIQEKITKEQNDAAENVAPLLEKEDAGTKLTAKEERSKSAGQTNLDNYAKITSGINEKLGKLADCDNLIPLYTKDFESKKDDIDWVKRAAGRMSSKECTADPFFEKLVVQLDKLDPSPKTKLYLGQLAEKNGDNSKAMSYYEQAAESETNKNDKAGVYMRLGEKMLAKKSYSQARSFYRKSLAAKPSNGRAYLRIAEMYAASANNCGKDQFEKRAVYWLAANYASKAASIDPSIADNAKKAAASYRGKAPSKTDIFNRSGAAGSTITFNNCWIGESVTVPSIK